MSQTLKEGISSSADNEGVALEKIPPRNSFVDFIAENQGDLEDLAK